VVIVAKEQDRVLMVGQHRFTIDSHTLEFPAGGIETGEKPVDAAKRELLEEAGYKAQSWTLAGELDDAIGIARHKAYVFFADDLMLTEADKNLEEHEDVVDSSEWINLDTVKRMIEENRITDTKTIAIFYKLLLAIT
jgi:ADP-ribose pyrophosphatase